MGEDQGKSFNCWWNEYMNEHTHTRGNSEEVSRHSEDCYLPCKRCACYSLLFWKPKLIPIHSWRSSLTWTFFLTDRLSGVILLCPPHLYGSNSWAGTYSRKPNDDTIQCLPLWISTPWEEKLCIVNLFIRNTLHSTSHIIIIQKWKGGKARYK